MESHRYSSSDWEIINGIALSSSGVAWSNHRKYHLPSLRTPLSLLNSKSARKAPVDESCRFSAAHLFLYS
ncbi:hypothetical protein PM082_023616 [Marasmius tenuissimus]|nr:hypothetical protein PM082_023616 [Marasmius tenuissimus]